MVNNKQLLDIIRYNHFSIREMALILDLTEDEFKKRLKTGVFQSNEIEMMLHFLKFPINPMKVFFDTYDYENPKKIEWWNELRKYSRGKIDIAEYLHRP